MNSKNKIIDNIYLLVLFAMAFALPLYFYLLKDYGIPAPVRLTRLMVIGFAPILFSMFFADITEMMLRKRGKKCDIEMVKRKPLLLYSLVLMLISFAGIRFAESVQGWEKTFETFNVLSLIGLGLCILTSILKKMIIK